MRLAERVRRLFAGWRPWCVAVVVGGLAAGAASAIAQVKERSPAGSAKPNEGVTPPENPFPGHKPKAPPLDGGIAWLNTAGPIELAKLKGKVVLLDFWTFCCINCMHILPELAKLEAEFPNELVVIGVHSAKFTGERDSQNIRDAILRYGIKHPVVNDAKMTIWREYGVRAWPTQALIDPEGFLIGGVSGEGNYEVIRGAIRKLIAYHKAKGTLDPKPIRFELEEYHSPPTPLRFPGKVAADPTTGRLYVADSSHHRIVVADLATGAVRQVIGDGVPALRDGAFTGARFNDPQGLAFAGNILYVADRRNHVLRRLDLDARTVTTIAGTGTQGHERRGGGPATQISLASPWDLLQIGTDLFVAMAGTHQIWKMDLTAGTIGVYAGSGMEDIEDGSPEEAAFAQPSGLATDGEWIYVADSEVSAVRKVGLRQPVVGRLVGMGLFEYGDVDGVGPNVRLQHALGVACANGLVYVADTYNNKLKVIDPRTRQATTFLGDGKAGAEDDPPRFDEPGGLAFAAGKLYVADTNNHRIRVVDLATKTVRTLALKGLPIPTPPEAEAPLPEAHTLALPPAVLKPTDHLQLVGSVVVPKGSKLNLEAPMSYAIDKIRPGGTKLRVTRGRIAPPQATFTLSLKDLSLADAHELQIAVTYYHCETGSEGVCRVETQVWTVPLRFDAAHGTDKLNLKAAP